MRYNRFGFFSNKHNTGSMEPYELNVNVTESANDTAVTYTIDTNISNSIDLVYTLSGNAVASDFTDNAIEGNISLDSSGNATFIKQVSVTNLDTDPTFGLQLRGISNTSSILYTGTTYTVDSTQGPAFTTTGIIPESANVTVGTDTYTVYNFTNNMQPSVAYDVSSILSGNVSFTNLGSNVNAVVEVLIVGGGGGAGNAIYQYSNSAIAFPGGGGGAGYNIVSTTFNTLGLGTNYPFTIGNRGYAPSPDAGAPGALNRNGTDGYNTEFLSNTVTGGGKGMGGSRAGSGSATPQPIVLGTAGAPNGREGGRGDYYQLPGTIITVPGTDGDNGNLSLTGWFKSPGTVESNAFTLGNSGSGSNSANSNAYTPYNAVNFGGGGGVKYLGTPFNYSFGRQGNAGTIQIRWLQQPDSRTISS
jgi:hypothetical protein